MPKANYTQRHDNECFEIPSGEVYRIACCDCGLVHDFVFVSHDGNPIGVAAKRNKRATGQRRRHETGEFKIKKREVEAQYPFTIEIVKA